MKEKIKAFFEKFYTKKNSRNTAGEIKQTIEVSKNDFDYLSPQFLIFGITPIATKIISIFFDYGEAASALISVLTIGVFIFQFLYFLMERAKLKKNGIVYNFHLYDAWGFVWFLFGSVSTAVLNVFKIFYTYEIMIPRVYLAAVTIWETLGIALAFIMIIFTGIALKNAVMCVVSTWLTALTPLMICINAPEEALISSIEAKKIIAYSSINSSIEFIKIIICIVYIIIGVCYIGRRKVIENGDC